MINDPILLKLDYVRLSIDANYAETNRQKFYSQAAVNSPRNSQRKLRPKRISKWCRNVPNEQQRKV